jgi:predicted nucleic acid-binding protein
VPDFVDTNTFIRLLTADLQHAFERCLALMERAERGEIRLTTSEIIIAEVVYVLSGSVYRVPRGVIAQKLRPVLENRGMTIEHKGAILDALERYGGSTLDFADCVAVAHMQRLGLRRIISYDRHFDRIPSIERVEP